MSVAIERDMVDGVRSVLTSRASLLRRRADELTVRVKDQWGTDVRIVPAEAVVMLRTAAFFEGCADDVGELAEDRGPCARSGAAIREGT